MCDFEVNLAAICAAHGFEPDQLLAGRERLQELVADGVVHMDDGVIRVRQDQRFVVRAVAAAFDAYLGQSGRAHSKAA